jgi:hypothetical protein
MVLSYSFTVQVNKLYTAAVVSSDLFLRSTFHVYTPCSEQECSVRENGGNITNCSQQLHRRCTKAQADRKYSKSDVASSYIFTCVNRPVLWDKQNVRTVTCKLVTVLQQC